MGEQNGLIKKLKIDRYTRRLILKKPETVEELDGLIYDREIGVGSYDFILIFVFSLPDMAAGIADVLNRKILTDHGLLYFTYPKKSSRRYAGSIFAGKSCIRHQLFARKKCIFIESEPFGQYNRISHTGGEIDHAQKKDHQ